MPVTRQQKTRGSDDSKQTIPTTSQKSIGHYGRVTKSQKVDQSAKKRKHALEEAVKDAPVVELVSADAKVKQESQSLEPATLSSEPEAKESNTRSRKRKTVESVETTPQHKRHKNVLPPTPAETPSKAASHLFDLLSIDSTAIKTPNKTAAVFDTPPLTPKSLGDLSELQDIQRLPTPLQDIIRLFSAFLTSTSLYYAHNGSGSPLQLSFVLQNVTKAWKKRAVTVLDIRRLLGVLGECNFEIVDNGDGMVCLEQIETSSAGHFNQPALKAQFAENLQTLWDEWTAPSQTRKQDVAVFLERLPLAKIHTGDLAPVKPTGSAKGQQRLDDLKTVAARARAHESTTRNPLVTAEQKTSAAVASRGSNLLDRILAKQSLLASQGSGPTQAEIERKTALNRIEDVIRVVDVLAGSRPRVAFSTQTLVSNLQNSLRNPISKEEAERCLELMAAEITPGFVNVIRSGQVKGVVVMKSGRPSNEELRLRLERAGV